MGYIIPIDISDVEKEIKSTRCWAYCDWKLDSADFKDLGSEFACDSSKQTDSASETDDCEEITSDDINENHSESQGVKGHWVNATSESHPNIKPNYHFPSILAVVGWILKSAFCFQFSWAKFNQYIQLTLFVRFYNEIKGLYFSIYLYV